MNELTNLLKTMQASLSVDLNLTGGAVDAERPMIAEEEWREVASASVKRQREFSCGRNHVHRLLEDMGLTDCVIGRDEKGCPVWPAEVVGSISHTNDYCVALLALSEKFNSVGIDLEEAGRMKPALWPRLFTQREMAGINALDELSRQMHRAAILFSAKEAFYKCDYPLNSIAYEFVEIDVALDESCRRLEIKYVADDRPTPYAGCYVSSMTHVMTVVYQTS